MNDNKWSVTKDCIFSWRGEYPPIESENDTDTYIRFMEQFSHIAEEEQILQLSDESLKDESFVSEMSYLERVHYLAKNKQLFLFLYGHFRSHATSSLVSYYDQKGTVVKNKISNMGALQKQINYNPSYIDAHYDLGPLEIMGLPVRIKKGDLPSSRLSLTVDVYTDIWFPYLIDWEKWFEDYGYEPTLDSLIDNTTLALEHTPRLNRFLERVRDLTFDYGGKWSLLEPLSPVFQVYTEMLTETGIKLNNLEK